MDPISDCGELCRDINTIAEWLAFDDSALGDERNSLPGLIVLLGNQTIPTLVTACDLARANPRQVLLFSGGIGHATHFLFENLADSPAYRGLVRAGDLAPQMGEAELYAVVARRVFEIPAERIRVEAQSTNGGENARFSLRLLQSQGLAGEPVFLLQDPLMQRRSVLTWQAEAERAGMSIGTVFSRAAFVPEVEPGSEGFPQLIAAQAGGTWTFPRFLGLLLGEVARLNDDENGYGPRGKGFIPQVDLPAEVWSAYHRLRASPLAEHAAR